MVQNKFFSFHSGIPSNDVISKKKLCSVEYFLLLTSLAIELDLRDHNTVCVTSHKFYDTRHCMKKKFIVGSEIRL